LRPIPRLRFGLGSGWLSTHEIDLESVSGVLYKAGRIAAGLWGAGRGGAGQFVFGSSDRFRVIR